MNRYAHRRHRLQQLITELAGGKPARFAELYGYSRAQIAQYLDPKYNNGRSMGEAVVEKIEIAVKRPGWFSTPLSQPLPKYALIGSGETPDDSEFVEIERVFQVRGSCGGGVMNLEERINEPVAFQRSWLQKRGLRAEDLIAIYADGSSMADFIVDGDMVIFDISKRDVVSGKIYAIQHPEGVRIKVIRRNLDGSFVLSSMNQDKSRYPDEHIAPTNASLLSVIGEFVHRAGG